MLRETFQGDVPRATRTGARAGLVFSGSYPFGMYLERRVVGGYSSLLPSGVSSSLWSSLWSFQGHWEFTVAIVRIFDAHEGSVHSVGHFEGDHLIQLLKAHCHI